MTQVPADYLSTTSSYNYEPPLPSVARASTLTKVPPAKKITFFKSGDPQFAGVKMAINQRSFKSFNALMDDLSHRVPLPFGVRTITTPRGIHCISELDQLEDGGCYLCSDKKYVKPISITSGGHRPAPPRSSRPSSTMRRAAQEGKLEDYSAPFTHHGPRIPKKITLVKNGESGFRRSIILNRRNARSFKTLLDEITEILQFPVKKLYTIDGKKIDSMQALLHCPNVLVCVGREPFKPVSMENLRKHSVEKLPNLPPRSNNGNNVNENNEMNFGLKAKKSVIHPRSASSNRSMRFSLSSEKSYPNGLVASPDNGGPFSNGCSHPKAGDLVQSLVNDDIEKRVHVNKDGSLSVEMKVRFRLLNDETLQWSTQIKKSNLMNQLPCEESGVEEDSGADPLQKMNPEASSEADDSLYPCDIDSYMSKLEESEYDEAHCHSCGKKHQDYDIWKNPMHMSQREEPGVRSTWHTRSSCSSTSSRRRVVHKKMTSVDSIHTTSSEEFSEHIVRESSSYSETIKNRVAYRSVKKCVCRSDLSTGASNGEEQQEYTRTSTGNSQRPSSLGLMSHSSCENNLDTQDSPEDQEITKIISQNEDANCFEASSVKCLKDDPEEVESSRVGSVMSRSSLQSRQSKKNVCEEVSSVGRSMSSSSLQKANQGENSQCSTPANSVHSKSSNCTTPKEKADTSEDNPVVSSFSSESCPKKEAEEVEAEQEESEVNEVSSVSAKTKPSQSIRGESSEGERCSTQGTHHSKASDRSSKKSGSDENVPCSVSCSSRGSKKSKRSHVHLDAQSEISVSSLESTLNKKNSLHADDVRSGSRASIYSKSSCETKKKSAGDTMSHKSGSLHSNISSTSEPEATAGPAEDKSSKSTANGYSECSKSSKKRSHKEENSKPSSLCSSVSSPNGKSGKGHARISSEPSSSKQGSMSGSVCSKVDHPSEDGIRNEKPTSSSSRVSSKSEIKDKCVLTQISQETDDRCSQSNVSLSSKSRQTNRKNLRVKVSNSSRASVSETMSVCSLQCPTPPKGKPKRKNMRATMLKNSSISSIGTESVLTAGREQKEIVDSSKATSYGSKSAATEGNGQNNKEIDDSCNKKTEEEVEDAGVQEEGGDLMPSALPNTSPEEVVQEWLRKIPSETLLMKYEMEDDGEEEHAESTTEVSHCTNAEEAPEEEKAEEKNEEEEEAEKDEVKDEEKDEAKDEVEEEKAEDTAVVEEAEECVNQEEISEVPPEAAENEQAECNKSVTSSQNNNKRDLPTSVQMSVQIMKALLSSKQETKFDRSNSLPEVSPTMGRKLSNSANILITCLASLQLLDEESEDPSENSKHLNKSRYTELLNIFQALWFGCTAERSGPSSGQEESKVAKPVSGSKAPKSMDHAFTPMSSSGVDVCSCSGGSGEECTAGATLVAQKTMECKSAEQMENAETGTEVTEVEEQSKEEEQPSRPSTACSEAKGEEKAESARQESVIQEEEENKEDQGSNCEHGQEEGEEKENEEENKLAEAGEQEEVEAVNDEVPQENPEEEADQPETTGDADVGDADVGMEPKEELQEQPQEESPNDPEPKVNTSTSVGTSLVQQNSVDPDPTWVLRLLKKIEKEFMAHYVNAMNEFKVRWNLQDNQQMDAMILELKEEVSKRIQKSIEKELRKIKSRAGRRMPRPPEGPPTRESKLQTEQRRWRLQTMHKKSLFGDKNGAQMRLEETSDLSYDVDNDFNLSAALEDSMNEQSREEEYCPCDSCVRKKLASRPARAPVVATNAPVMKAFDLQKILRLKKDGNEEAIVAEAAQDTKTLPNGSVEEGAENEEKDEEQPPAGETEAEEEEGKEPELNEDDGTTLNGDGEEPEVAESQNTEMEDEAKTEETKEEEAEGGEETKEGEEEEEAKEEDKEKEEEEMAKAEEEEEEIKEEEGETKEEDEEVKEEEAEESKEEEELNKEEEKEAEEGVKEEEEPEEEEGKEEDEEGKEEAEGKEEEEGKEREEEAKEEEEETKEEEEEEAKEEEEEEAKEEDEEAKEEEEEAKEEEEEEAKEEEEEAKEEEEEGKEEEEAKEKAEGEEEEEVEKGDEEAEEEEEAKEGEEEAKEEEEEEEEEGKEEGEEAKEEEETKEEEEAEEEEEEAKEEEEEEEGKEEEEEAKEEEEEGKEEEEEAKEEEEEGKEEEEEAKEEEEEGKEEEEEAKEEEEEGKEEEEEAKEEEEEGKEEEEEVKEEEEGKEEAEEAKEEEEEGKEEEEEVKEEEAKEEEEEEGKEEEEEEQEAEEKSKGENEGENEAEETEEPEDEEVVADDEAETSECRGDAEGSGTDNNPEGDAVEGSEEAEQEEAEAEEDAKPESGDETEEKSSERGENPDENGEEPTGDDPDNAHEKHEDQGNNKVSEKASRTKGKRTNKRLETLKKSTAFSCYSSVGNFSQQSQKGSDDEEERVDEEEGVVEEEGIVEEEAVEEECKGDDNPTSDHPNGEVRSDESSKPSQMYPDSEEEEEDKESSGSDPVGDEEQPDAEGADPKEAENTEEVQADKKKENSDEIDQDDLDF
ncbi:retinitis pigmentosa 1-like 1 protein [Agelaius phoeniceus]|uniref:retinitis pigmentosa 1-like 1 protein n=1 Tax=Agelaius phoeniceus TaxID=39638 RepID=UPI004054DBC3